VNTIVWVAAGGALGAVSRYGFNAGILRAFGDNFPWGILLVNVLGCFLMGLASAYMIEKMPVHDGLKIFITTGFLGGFTTFSAFAYDTMKLIQAGQSSSALFYVAASVLLSIVAVFAGFALSRVLA
jgi:fluoride exporter